MRKMETYFSVHVVSKIFCHNIDGIDPAEEQEL